MTTARGLEGDHATDRLTPLHQLKALVDVRKRHNVSDHRVNLNLSSHVPINYLRYISASTCAAKRRAFPLAPGDELKWTCRNFRACRGYADYNRLAPSSVACFKSLPHHRYIAGAIEGVVGAT